MSQELKCGPCETRCANCPIDWRPWEAAQSQQAAAQAPAAEPLWQPIETLPDDTLAILYGAKRSEMVIGMRHSRDGWVIDTPSEWASMYPPKLWQPLPALPAALAAAKEQQ